MNAEKPEDATEALLDKMAKDSFPASDPPQVMGTAKSDSKIREASQSTPAAVAELELGEEVEGAGADTTLVFEGRDAAIIRLVAEGRRLQLALPCNPLEMCAEDLDALIAALARSRRRMHAE